MGTKRSTILRIVLLAWAALFYLVAPARADQSDAAVRYFCGPGHEAEAGLVRAESRHHLTSAAHLALLMFAESGCHAGRVNATTGAAGLYGIMPGRSADPDHLEAAELMDPAINAHLGARHLSGLITLCGSFPAGLHLYHSKDGKCRNWRWDKHVAKLLRLERAFWRWLARQSGRVS
jgi:hypothetical protein